MTVPQTQPAPRRVRKAPVFKSNLTRLRYAVRATSIDLNMTETEYRDLLESVSPYRYARLCTEQQLEAALERLDSRKPTAPELGDDELEAYCRDLLEVA